MMLLPIPPRQAGDAQRRQLHTTLKAALLLAIVALGYYLRYRYWILSGGLDASYSDWATQYYGGITPAYLGNAELLLHGRWAEMSRAYPPGYPALIALVKLGGISDPQSFRLVQIAFDSAAAVAAYAVARGLRLGTTAAFLAAILYAIMPTWGWGSTTILAESLLPALTLVALLVLIRVKSSRRLLRWFSAGFVLGLLPLIRPEMILFFAPLALWALVATSSAAWHRRGAIAAVALLGFAPPGLAVAAANYVHHKHFFITDNISGYALFTGLGQIPNPYGYYADDPTAGRELEALGMAYRSPESERHWRGIYWNAWREHPEHVLATIAHRLHLIVFEWDIAYPAFRDFLRLAPWAPYLLPIGIVVLIARRQYADVLLLAGPLAYAIATNGLMYVELRYIRYAHVSYLLAAAVCFDALLHGWRLLTPALPFPRAMSRLGAAAVLIVGLYFAYWVARETTALDRVTRNIAALRPFASGASAAALDGAFVAVHEWEPDHGIVASRNGQPVVVGSRATSGYQAKHRIDARGTAGLEVEFRATVSGGAAKIGILSPRWDQYTAAGELAPNAATSGRLVGAVYPTQAMVMIATASADPTEITVELLRYRRICTALRPDIANSLAERVRNWAFPRPGDWGLAACPPPAG